MITSFILVIETISEKTVSFFILTGTGSHLKETLLLLQD